MNGKLTFCGRKVIFLDFYFNLTTWLKVQLACLIFNFLVKNKLFGLKSHLFASKSWNHTNLKFFFIERKIVFTLILFKEFYSLILLLFLLKITALHLFWEIFGLRYFFLGTGRGKCDTKLRSFPKGVKVSKIVKNW